MSNAIYFRRANKVIVDDADDSLFNFAEVASLDANLRKLGYALDGSLAERLVHAPVSAIKSVHDTIVSEAKEIKGVRRYSPMYPNFPHQVMEASSAELYINAIVHYFGTATGLRIMPDYDKLERPELDFDESKVTVVGLGSEIDFLSLMKKLVTSNSAFSESDRADISALSAQDFFVVVDDETFPNRENMAFLAALHLNHGGELAHLDGDTATDILRLAVAMSDGDVSLSENTRFRNFKRSERRMLLGLLHKVEGGIVEDMMRHQSAWKRLGERLHPGEYNQYPGVQEAFRVVRENGASESFNARVEKALADGDPLGAARILKARPGEFARRLDKVLRTNATPGVQATILRLFNSVAHKASPTVLLQARNAFVNREKNVRVFFPKGSVAKMQSVRDERRALSAELCSEVVDAFDFALLDAFSSRETLGGSWVDPALKGIAIPFGLRNASKSVKTFGRGSRLPLGEDTNIIRLFSWWTDAPAGGSGASVHTDLDLSAVFFNEDFGCMNSVSYMNLRTPGAVHSGDITIAPEGASEFVDIDIDRLLSAGVRYIAMTQHVYSGQTFEELPECFSGFMERRGMNSGEVYDPRTVSNKADLTAKSSGATPFIFDLKTREAIWVDLSIEVHGSYSNVRTTAGQITSTVEAMTTLTPPSLYDLFSLHAIARGGIVPKEKAKTVFAFDGDVTPFDVETILSEYL